MQHDLAVPLHEIQQVLGSKILRQALSGALHGCGNVSYVAYVVSMCWMADCFFGSRCNHILWGAILGSAVMVVTMIILLILTCTGGVNGYCDHRWMVGVALHVAVVVVVVGGGGCGVLVVGINAWRWLLEMVLGAGGRWLVVVVVGGWWWWVVGGAW